MEKINWKEERSFDEAEKRAQFDKQGKSNYWFYLGIGFGAFVCVSMGVLAIFLLLHGDTHTLAGDAAYHDLVRLCYANPAASGC